MTHTVVNNKITINVGIRFSRVRVSYALGHLAHFLS